MRPFPEYLVPQGFRVDVAHDGAVGLDRAISGDFSLVVLDVMLPQIHGFEALRQIRLRSRLPVIMLTARGDDVDRIVGLEIGADDYSQSLLIRANWPHVFTPFCGAASPRAEPRPRSDTIVLGDIELDTRARMVRRKDREIELTSVEFDLLAFFLKLPGHVVPRDDMVKAVLAANSCPSTAA